MDHNVRFQIWCTFLTYSTKYNSFAEGFLNINYYAYKSELNKFNTNLNVDFWNGHNFQCIFEAYMYPAMVCIYIIQFAAFLGCKQLYIWTHIYVCVYESQALCNNNVHCDMGHIYHGPLITNIASLHVGQNGLFVKRNCS